MILTTNVYVAHNYQAGDDDFSENKEQSNKLFMEHFFYARQSKYGQLKQSVNKLQTCGILEDINMVTVRDNPDLLCP